MKNIKIRTIYQLYSSHERSDEECDLPLPKKHKAIPKTVTTIHVEEHHDIESEDNNLLTVASKRSRMIRNE